MSLVRNIAGVARGMSITFREMLNLTEENYPDGRGPKWPRGNFLFARDPDLIRNEIRL
jgi:hypothetical protein